jgi:DNA-binding XRE family transcriptional regulator
MWTEDQKLRASAKAAARWRATVQANPDSSKLAKARAFRAITQRELSAGSGVSVSAIVAAENGGPISLATQERLSLWLALPELFQ